jgi:hypothetical protein
VPLELVALAYARRLGRTMLGFDDLHRREVNWRQIFGSSIPGAAADETGAAETGAGAADPASTR